MFYTIYIIHLVRGKVRSSQVLDHFRDLRHARIALSRWTKGVLDLNPEKRILDKKENLPPEMPGKMTVIDVTRIADGAGNGYEAAIARQEFADETKGFFRRMADVQDAAARAIREAVPAGATVELPWDEENEAGENTGVDVSDGDGLPVPHSVLSVTHRTDGKVLVRTYNENTGNVKDVLLEWVFGYSIPALADAVLQAQER